MTVVDVAHGLIATAYVVGAAGYLLLCVTHAGG
jgi:hypothetical protein